MKRYVSKFEEDINNNANDLAVEIEKTIRSIFPKSYVEAYFQHNIYPSITVRFALGKDKSEWINGYIENDPAHHILRISPSNKTDISDTGEYNSNLEFKILAGGSFYVKPTTYLAYDRVKVPFRKVNGNGSKIIEGIKKYFLSLKKLLQENREKITDDHIELVGKKF